MTMTGGRPMVLLAGVVGWSTAPDDLLDSVMRLDPAAVGTTLALVAVAVLLEGPIAMVASGALAGAGLLDWWAVLLTVVAADVVSDTVFYALGRGGRRPRIAPLLLRLGLTDRRRAQLSGRVRDRLPWVVAGAKLVDVGAIPAFLAIGLAGVSYHRLLAWVVPASLLRCAVLVGLGWLVGDRLAEELAENPWIVVGIGVGVGVALVALRAAWMRFAPPRWRGGADHDDDGGSDDDGGHDAGDPREPAAADTGADARARTADGPDQGADHDPGDGADVLDRRRSVPADLARPARSDRSG